MEAARVRGTIKLWSTSIVHLGIISLAYSLMARENINGQPGQYETSK